MIHKVKTRKGGDFCKKPAMKAILGRKDEQVRDYSSDGGVQTSVPETKDARKPACRLKATPIITQRTEDSPKTSTGKAVNGEVPAPETVDVRGPDLH